jgi:cell division protein FtsB
MSLFGIIITVIALGSIIGSVYFIKKSAQKFNLTPEQLEKVKKRNDELDREEEEKEKDK